MLALIRHMALIGCLTLCPAVHAGEIAITIDDLPYIALSDGTPETGLSIVESVNAALARHDITATGFVVGQSVTPATRPALEAFAAAGHTVANHSWAHRDYDSLSISEFRESVSMTDRVINDWVSHERFYRFPYLREGETAGARQAADDVLADLGYRNAPVTIDNDEWIYNRDYVAALEDGDADTARDIAAEYLAHMKERTRHFQSLAQEAVGRDVKHTLLVHMNRINADHLGELLDWYRSEGWRFITLRLP